MKLVDTLEELGLTPAETRVYQALLEIGKTTTGPIIDEAGIAPSKVYVILEKLERKGLVAHTFKQKVKYFEPTDPRNLLRLVEEKQELLGEQRKQLEGILPELQNQFGAANIREPIQVFSGLRGIQAARERTLEVMKPGDSMWIVGISKTPYDRLTTYFKDYHARRIKKGIYCRYLYNFDADEFGRQSATYEMSEVRYMPKGMTTHAWMEIYADTVTIGLNYRRSLSIVIQNPDIADSFRRYAEVLWSVATPAKNRK